ncbi:MAG TPA: hypothetical protein VF278_18340, partial [Pirellulales bacterium]
SIAEADRCAAALGETPTLVRDIDLTNSGLTDEGLARLSTQPMLEQLHIRGTKVTSAGVEAFKKALPDCNVDWEPTSPANEDPNRAVAEWVLKHGGTVTVVSTPGTPAYLVASVEQLPVGFELFSLWSPFSPEPPRPPISEEELISQMRRLRGNLWGLGVDNVGLSDAGLRELTMIPALANLDILRIRNGAITDDGLARLTAFANLWFLEIIGQLDVTPNGIGQLRALPKLKYLTLNSTGLSDAHLAELRNMDLEGLEVPNHAGITDAGMSHLAGMRNLRDLHVQGTQVTGAGLHELRQLPRLFRLFISASQADGLQSLRTLRWLQLTLASSHDLTHLANLPQLRTIWIFGDVAIEEGDRAELAKKNPLCRLIVGNTPPKAIGEDHRRALAERLQNRGATLASNLPANDRPVEIVAINLPPQFALDDEDRRLLGALDYLHRLSAPSIAEADRCAAALGETPTLVRDIDLTGSGLTDAGLEHLTRMASLVELDIRETRVTAAGVEALRKALPDCKIHANPPAAKTAD